MGTHTKYYLSEEKGDTQGERTQVVAQLGGNVIEPLVIDANVFEDNG